MALAQILASYTTPTQALADLLSLVPGPMQPIPVESVKAWALRQSGLIYQLKQTAKGTTAAAPLADTVLEAIGVNMPPWDMSNPANIGLMDAVVAAGLVTAQQKADLLLLADTQIPKWQSLGLKQAPQLWQIEEERIW